MNQLEFLELKWAVVDILHDYLYGSRFVITIHSNTFSLLPNLQHLATVDLLPFQLKTSPYSINEGAANHAIQCLLKRWEKTCLLRMLKLLLKQIWCGKSLGQYINCAVLLLLSDGSGFPSPLDNDCSTQQTILSLWSRSCQRGWNKECFGMREKRGKSAFCVTFPLLKLVSTYF